MGPLPTLDQIRRRLQRLLRRRGQAREDADDVIQDAFLRLQVYYQKGAEVREPEAFLVRTALRLSSNARRDARRRTRAEDRIKDFPVLDTEPAPEDLVAAEEALDGMSRKLEQLSERTRDIFLLHRVDGLSYAQIAKLYGLTHKAVERRIARAMLAVFQEESERNSP